MSDFQLRISRASKTVLGDVVFNMLMVFALLFIILPHNPKKEENKKEEVKSAGDMMVEIHWQDGVDIDIDLWVKSPDDDKPVGYSNRAGRTFNLLRDDLGMSQDSTNRNFEMVYARGLPAGEYVVNVHEFRNYVSSEVPVDVVVSAKSASETAMRVIITRKVTLHKEEELTVVRFVIREDGSLDSDSVNDIQQELRTWKPATQ